MTETHRRQANDVAGVASALVRDDEDPRVSPRRDRARPRVHVTAGRIDEVHRERLLERGDAREERAQGVERGERVRGRPRRVGV